jgi:hypothetical protein
VRVAAASGALGPGAAPAAGARLRADLPLLLGAAAAPARARAQLTLAEGLLSAASAAQLAADPDRRALTLILINIGQGSRLHYPTSQGCVRERPR